MKKKVILLSLLMFFALPICASSDTKVKGYAILGGINNKTAPSSISGKSFAVNCTTENGPDQAVCDKHSTSKSSCEMLNSVEEYVCNPSGETFCLSDSDCIGLGKNKCTIGKGSTVSFKGQFDSDESAFANVTLVGICVSAGGSGEDNAFGQAICNLMVVVTGNAGRAVVGVVVIVVGIMFFLGKVTWSLVLAIALGAGAIFGAPAIVKIVTGKAFTCIVIS